MNACHIRILTLFLILPVFLATTRAEGPENINIPSQISAFYESYNFISSYSTTTERRRLIGYLGEAETPKDLKCKRLENVLTRMKKLRQMIFINDSEMVIWSDIAGSFFGFHFRPVLFVVSDVRLSEGTAQVEVRAYELEPDMILRFIGDYDTYTKGGEKSPSLEELPKNAMGMAPGLEIHRWCCQSGKWMKRASDHFFLDEKN